LRNTFISVLTELAARDQRIVLLTGDLGYSVLEKYALAHPERFFNFGISEQNMTGAAAGLALSGKKVFVYSIATFATMRPFEQIRIDIGFQRANVVIVGVGAGLSYGSLGPTHHATEDVALMRSIPGMTVLCPADVIEADLSTRAAAAHDGPVYLLLGGGKGPPVHTHRPDFAIGKALLIRDGHDVTLIATGEAVAIASEAAELLAGEFSVRLLSVPCVKPIDAAAITAAGRETRLIVTVEEHSVIGGLGTAVAEVLAGCGSHAPLSRIGVQDTFFRYAGSQSFLRSAAGLTADGIAAVVRQLPHNATH